MRIYDDPGHPQYGPVRRTWVVLVQLDLLVAAERWSDYTQDECDGLRWDGWVAQRIPERGRSAESAIQRDLICLLCEGWVS